MDKGIIIAYLALALLVGCFAAFVVYLDECVKSLYRERSKVNGDISEAEGRLSTLRGLCDAASVELDETMTESKDAIVTLAQTKAEIDDLQAELACSRNVAIAAREEAMSYAAYSAAGCALLNGLDLAETVFPVHEVPYLASGIDTLGLRHPAGYEMKRKGLLTVGDVVKTDPDTLKGIMGIGPGTVDSIARKLEENGCCFGMEFVRINDRYFVKD